MEKDTYLKSLADKITAMQERSIDLINQARENSTLKYYHDERCGENEVIKLENGKEQIISKLSAGHINEIS